MSHPHNQMTTADMRLKQLFDAHPSPLIITGQSYEILSANAASRSLLSALGYIDTPSATLNGRHIDSLFHSIRSTSEIELPRQGRDPFFYRVETSEMEWGEQAALIWSFEDITKEYERENKLKQAVSELEQINALKSDFLSFTSHQLRTPLTATLSSIELMQEYLEKLSEAPDNPQWLHKAHHHARRSKKAVIQLEELIKGMLLVEDTQTPDIDLHKACIPVRLLFNDVLHELRGLIEKKQLTVNVICHSELIAITDEMALRHIVKNLISNAIGFCHQSATIILKAQAKETALNISITDKSGGFPEEVMERLGDTLVQPESLTSIQGMGLGVRIIQKYVELLNGQFYIDSEKGQGNHAWVVIPNTIETGIRDE